jgi:hypothetical protein
LGVAAGVGAAEAAAATVSRASRAERLRVIYSPIEFSAQFTG